VLSWRQDPAWLELRRPRDEQPSSGSEPGRAMARLLAGSFEAADRARRMIVLWRAAARYRGGRTVGVGQGSVVAACAHGVLLVTKPSGGDELRLSAGSRWPTSWLSIRRCELADAAGGRRRYERRIVPAPPADDGGLAAAGAAELRPHWPGSARDLGRHPALRDTAEASGRLARRRAHQALAWLRRS